MPVFHIMPSWHAERKLSIRSVVLVHYDTREELGSWEKASPNSFHSRHLLVLQFNIIFMPAMSCVAVHSKLL